MIQLDREYILPVRFDDTPVPGLHGNISYVRDKDYTPAQLTALIVEADSPEAQHRRCTGQGVRCAATDGRKRSPFRPAAMANKKPPHRLTTGIAKPACIGDKGTGRS